MNGKRSVTYRLMRAAKVIRLVYAMLNQVVNQRLINKENQNLAIG